MIYIYMRPCEKNAGFAHFLFPGWGSFYELDVFDTGLAELPFDLLRLKEFKFKVTQVVREYFESGDKQDALECLKVPEAR